MLDVLIAGAGPVGLSLALGLARAGKSVLVLEKKDRFDPHSRAPAIWPRTQEILAGLGVIDRFVREGIVRPDFNFTDADKDRVLLSLSFRELAEETKFPQALILPQNKTEQFLYEALSREPKAEVKFSSEVVKLLHADTHVTVEYKQNGQPAAADALYVAGCDGAHSAVREALGFTLEGRTYGIRAALADVHLGDDKPYDFPRFSTQGPFAAGILIEKSLWRLILLYPSSSLLSLDERVKEGVRGLFGQDRYELVWQSEFHLHQRLSSGFVSGRAALAGDAAHLNSPVGGQGMNAGIQDTEVLCKTLLKALDCRDPEELRAYERERRLAVRKGVNRFTNQLTKVLLFRDGRYIKTILGLAGHVLKIPSLRHAFLRRMAMLPRR